ncbi:aromatic ring-hydroxylating dioxygenase subunit alpha [Streptomyces sp. NPDC002896]|uniref:aromatic ring-hydroxylating dioxygenase subunit alpha n=1 Tax=Streptomyces sp. NPDC002896 TaxID=3154438 RepID=UPI003331ABDA
MMREQDNIRLTRTGSGTPAGEWMRRYWQPVALAEELDGERPLVTPRVLGQDLVLFRDEEGHLGLVDRGCPHRGADLALARLEDGGLRCVFHGWLFAAGGRCLEMPAEPEGSLFPSKVRLGSYPVQERNGIVWGYLGPGEPPAFPALDCFAAPEAYTFAWKGHLDCNWLQALEVGIDPAHASYLHRFFVDEDPEESYGKQFRAASQGTELPMTKILREYPRPRIDVQRTDYGMRLTALRRLDGPGLDGSHTHVRVTHQVFPHAFHIPMSADMAITQWHVPIDDTSCYWYAVFTSLTGEVDQAEMRRQRVAAVTLPDYRPVFHRGNNYGYDPREQRDLTYTGLGTDINVHDQWAVEGQGAIQDRTREHLGSSDRGITTYRKLLAEAIGTVERGETPRFVTADEEEAAAFRGPVALDGVGPSEDWEAHWDKVTTERRSASPWAGVPQAAR